MPAAPIEVRISRLAMAPGTTIAVVTVLDPALMCIETGTSACPGGPGRIGYGRDGTIVEKTTGEGIESTPAGSIQLIPSYVPDGAGNQGTDLMNSMVIECVPVNTDSSPTPAPPVP